MGTCSNPKNGPTEVSGHTYRGAERSYLYALSASEITQGGPERIAVLQNLASLYMDTGQYSKCERIREQLEKLRPGALENHPVEAAALLNVIASLEHVRKRDDQAEHYSLRSQALLRQMYGPVTLDAALVESNRGFLRLEAREYESAAALLRQAIREIEIASGPENQALIRPLVNLARCENMAGHPNEAEAVARRAVELSVKIFGEWHPLTATAMLEQASALGRLGRKGPARNLKNAPRPAREIIPRQTWPATRLA